MVRSAIAPDTIVAVVAQNTKLNTKLDQSKLAYDVKISNPGFPISPIISSPSTGETNQENVQAGTHTESISVRHENMTGILCSVNPAATIANPACIQNTSAAPIRNQTPYTCPLITLTNISSVIILPPLDS